MGHRRGRRRRSPHRPRRLPLTEIYRPGRESCACERACTYPTRENTPAGEDRPVRNPLGIYVLRIRWWWFLLEKADGPGDSSRERSFGQDAVVIGCAERGREIEGKAVDRYRD